MILPPWCGKSPKVVTTMAGAVEVVSPWINDKRVDADTAQRVRFRSVTLSPWCRKSPKVVEVLPLLYLHGLLSGDFVQRWRPEPVLRRRA